MRTTSARPLMPRRSALRAACVVVLVCLLALTAWPGRLLADGDVAPLLAQQQPLWLTTAGPAENATPPLAPDAGLASADASTGNSTSLDAADSAGAVPEAVPPVAASQNSAPPAAAPSPAAVPNASAQLQGDPPAAQPGSLPMPTISWQSYFKALGGLFLILALVFAGLYLLKRLAPRAGFGGSRDRQLQLESTLSLGPRKSVAVVRFLNKQLVLGVTDTHITCLHIQEEDHAPSDEPDMPDQPERSDQPERPGQEPDVLKSFAERLKDHS